RLGDVQRRTLVEVAEQSLGYRRRRERHERSKSKPGERATESRPPVQQQQAGEREDERAVRRQHDRGEHVPQGEQIHRRKLHGCTSITLPSLYWPENHPRYPQARGGSRRSVQAWCDYRLRGSVSSGRSPGLASRSSRVSSIRRENVAFVSWSAAST